jgi:hypothetical protein
VFFTNTRFHFPIVPAFCLLAGWGVVGTVGLVRDLGRGRRSSPYPQAADSG